MSDHILVVDDDAQLTAFLERYLRKQGYVVTCAATAAEMEALLASQRFDLCVLDIGLPDRDGFELMQEFRHGSSLPIVVLTARDEVFDRIVGLELGADDYVTKPFEPRELLARIKSVLRRSRPRPDEGLPAGGNHKTLRFGAWTLDVPARQLANQHTGEVARLTSTEFSLLKALAEQPNVVLSRDKLIDLVHGPAAYITDRTVDVHIARLRRKIEEEPKDPVLIKTVHGTGYVFAARVERGGM